MLQQKISFNSNVKSQVSVGQELYDHGLIWRKLSNGTGVWRYDFRINRKRFKGTLGKEQHGVTLSAARKRLIEEKARATLEAPSSKLKNSPAYKSFKDVADDYLKWAKNNLNGYRQIEGRLKLHLSPVLSEVVIQDITTSDVEQLKTSLINSDYSPSTIKKIISLLSSIFNHAKKSDRSISNPTVGLSRIRDALKDIQTLTDAEVLNLLDASSHDTKLTTIIGLANFAGLRASEILGLEWKNVDLEKNQIKVCQRIVEGEFKEITKSGKIRIIPIGVTLLTILKKHKLASSGHSFLICNKDGGYYYQIQKLFRTIKKISGAEFEGGVHILRHTFATTAVKKGVDLPTLQLWMGHSDIKTTMRYVHINYEHSAEQMKLLG